MRSGPPAVRRRSNLEIELDVLRALADGPTTPSKLCLRANVSWNVLYRVLNELIQVGYVESKDSGKRREYSMTEKGRQGFRDLDNSLSALRGTWDIGSLVYPTVNPWSFGITVGTT
jgi:predicted transcriptional regulator